MQQMLHVAQSSVAALAREAPARAQMRRYALIAAAAAAACALWPPAARFDWPTRARSA